MKFPIIATAFGHPKVILEIRGNTAGLASGRQSGEALEQHERRRSHHHRRSANDALITASR